MKKYCYLLVFLLVNSLGLKAGTIALKDVHVSYDLAKDMKLLVDEPGSLTFHDVLKRTADFKKMEQPVLNFGPSDVAVWLRFVIRNDAGKEWFLHIGAPFLTEIDLYKTDGKGGFIKSEMSSARPFAERPVLTTQMILPLNAAGGETVVYYLRVRSNAVLRVPLEVATMQYLFEQSQSVDIWNGMYFGLILALVLYNLFVFISLRERAYLFYVFYVFFIALNIAYTKGYFLQFVVPGFPQANHSNFTGSLACIFLLLFARTFLDTGLRVRHSWKIENVLFLLCIICIAISLNGQRLEGFVLIWVISLLVIIYILIASTIVVLKGFRPARFFRFGPGIISEEMRQCGFKPARIFLFGFFILSAGIIIYALKDQAILPQNWFTENAYILGSALEAIILSYALAKKLHIYKREKEESQLEALAQATLFSHQLIESQENERKRVAAELHDSLGQSLGMVKNKVLMLKRDMEKPLAKEKHVTDLEKMVGENIQEVRNISYNLRPLHLDLLGITQSVNSLLEDVMESGTLYIVTDIELFDNLLSKSNEINVFRIIQECFNNIVKHAQATEARISIRREQNELKITIADNGIGMQQAGRGKNGFGLLGIRERLNILNGYMEITCNQPHGTILNFTILI
ncbi:sensor histidine kinase [Dyadobacter pollutisoli]|uniref:histidine kinase n=1 Tax=Dyadobacter pollutisoli TaxID=2910158 RepID=A0A9E8NGD0_9BACT|nr:7TM diverse intracellular signaling domain-containing protein [Dyadobacter pollutisoli]WAC14497.1 histidine kinase [Dyadobacter pollutisoli]